MKATLWAPPGSYGYVKPPVVDSMSQPMIPCGPSWNTQPAHNIANLDPTVVNPLIP